MSHRKQKLKYPNAKPTMSITLKVNRLENPTKGRD